MGFLEEMRWWHWIVVSLVIGAALGFVNGSNIEPPLSFRSMNQFTFESELLQAPDTIDGKALPWISNIVVYPPMEVTEAGKKCYKQLVTFDWLISSAQLTSLDPYVTSVGYPFEAQPANNVRVAAKYPGVTVYQAKDGDTIDSIVSQQFGKYSDEGKAAFVAANKVLRDVEKPSELTIKPGNDYYIPKNPDSNYGIANFLDEISANGGIAPYRYLWWRSQTHAYEIWMGGSFIVLGLIWPALIRVMIYGGFGRDKTGGNYDLSRFGEGQTSENTTTNAEVSEDDLARLKELEENYIGSLVAKAEETSAEIVAAGPPKIKELSDQPIQPMTHTPEGDEKKFAGQFYPVEQPEKHKDEK